MSKQSFENNLIRLEEIVKLLETGETTLDESINLYKEGIELSKACHQALEEAKQTIEKLTVSKEES